MRSVNKKFIVLIFFVVILVILGILVPCVGKAKLNAKIQSEMQALGKIPAAQYCKNSGGKLDIKVDELLGVYGMCKFDDGSACEIVEYFKGECLSTTEKNETEISYCSGGINCEDEQSDSLSDWISDMNSIEDLDKEMSGEIIEEMLDDNFDDLDFDSLYDYYESEFINSGDENGNISKGKIKGGENTEDQLSMACDSVGGMMLKDKCYLSNGIEIVF